jgi:sterol 3beta-glucosyltransferase
MSKQSELLHMRDVDDDVPVNITTSEEKNAMHVDVKEEDLDLSNASISESPHLFWFYQL